MLQDWKKSRHIHDALRKGLKRLPAGKRHALGGNYYEPTVLTGVTPDMKIAQEETFGPVAALFRFKTEEEAVAMANDTEFGLAAYFYTQDAARVWRVGAALEYGIVGINEGIISTEVAPFGGIKESGLGREGSRYGSRITGNQYMCWVVYGGETRMGGINTNPMDRGRIILSAVVLFALGALSTASQEFSAIFVVGSITVVLSLLAGLFALQKGRSSLASG